MEWVKLISDFAVGALANRSSVCAGYAQCYQFLLSQVGVQSIYIAANTTKEPHAWNLVKIDGHYFHVDCTWDRGLGANPNVNHTYFMLNVKNLMLMEHIQKIGRILVKDILLIINVV